MKKFFLLPLIALFATFTACEKDEDPPTPTAGDFNVEFTHVWAANELPFLMNTDFFHPKTSDTLNFSEFKYYVCNFKLQKEENTWWESTDFYHLIDLNTPATLRFTFANIPAGTYKSMQFMLGVDSARTVSGPHTGDLDPANGMFWNATDGFIMVKAEGFAPFPTGAAFQYHLGGYQGPDKVGMIKTVVFPSTKLLIITGTSTPKVMMQTNTGRLFHNYGSVSNGNVTALGASAAQMAFDFYDAIRLSDVLN